MALEVEISDEAKALSALLTKLEAENERDLADQMALDSIKQSMGIRRSNVVALCESINKIVISMARSGKPLYTVQDLIQGATT